MTHLDTLIAEKQDREQTTKLKTMLEQDFFPTKPFFAFRTQMFTVLETREERLKFGLTEQKGAALIAPSGAGKSRMVKQAIEDYHAVSEATDPMEFGHKIVSAIVPGRSTVKETSKAILRELGYPVVRARDEDYLVHMIMDIMKQQRVAGLHLDEVQDAGRHTTVETMKVFAKRFRNMMQDSEWPVCLILSATLEGREFINHDATLTRRLHPIEILPMTLASDGRVLRDAVAALLKKAGVADSLGLFAEDDFMKILLHAAAYRFGVAIEMTINAICDAVAEGDSDINLDHFAGAYYFKTNSDDDMNPFMTPHWQGIDTTKALDRNLENEPPPKRMRRTI